MIKHAISKMAFKSLPPNNHINKNLYDLSVPIGYQLCASLVPWLSDVVVNTPSNIRTKSASQTIRQYAPYLFTQIDEKSDLWLPINRYYKPLGVYTNEYVDYEKYRALAISGKYLNLTGTKRGYLYNDATFPRTVKLARRYVQILLNALNAVDQDKKYCR